MNIFKANVMLLTAAAIWGLAFVAQRVGMEYIGPFTFNGVRFLLGVLSLLPWLLRQPSGSAQSGKAAAQAGLMAGLVLFCGASLQQIGLVYTTAGKAAFITCLYIVLVPLAGIFLKQSITRTTWLGSLLALGGLYLLCVKEGLTIAYGEMLELWGAFFWTMHILLIDKFSRQVNVLQLSVCQFITCGVLSLLAAAFLEDITLAGLTAAAVPLFYGGVCSVGIAYTLQVVGQKYAQPAHAAIILSMETVFAALGGWLLLNERLLPMELAGCVIMLAGMLLSQAQNFTGGTKAEEKGTACRDCGV